MAQSSKRRLFKKSKTTSESAAIKPQKEKLLVQKKKEQKQVEKGSLATKAKTKSGFWASQNYKENKKPQFPKIPRVIPETTTLLASIPLSSSSIKPTQGHLKWGILIVLIVLGLVWNYLIVTTFAKKFTSWSGLLVKREKLREQMSLWENITKQYPNYRDANVEGEIYAYMLADKGKEQYFLQNLQLLDPNFPLTKTLEQLMNLQSIN